MTPPTARPRCSAAAARTRGPRRCAARVRSRTRPRCCESPIGCGGRAARGRSPRSVRAHPKIGRASGIASGRRASRRARQMPRPRPAPSSPSSNRSYDDEARLHLHRLRTGPQRGRDARRAARASRSRSRAKSCAPPARSKPRSPGCASRNSWRSCDHHARPRHRRGATRQRHRDRARARHRRRVDAGRRRHHRRRRPPAHAHAARPGRAGHVPHPVPDRRLLREPWHRGFFPVVEIQFTVHDGARTITCRCCSARSASRRTAAAEIQREPMKGGPRPGIENMSARTSLPEKKLAKALDRINRAQSRFLRRYPGDSGARQAVHTVYGGAHLFKAETPAKLGELALKALDTYAPDPSTFGEAIGIRGDLAAKVMERVRDKLRREAGRGLPHRLRGRLRQSPRRRGRRSRRQPPPPRSCAATPPARCRRSSASGSSR